MIVKHDAKMLLLHQVKNFYTGGGYPNKRKLLSAMYTRVYWSA